MNKIFYATETYIMPFLEAAQFLNAQVLAGRKENFTLRPGSHLHKITNEPVFYMALAPYDFATGQRHYLQISTFWVPNGNSRRSLPFQATENS